MTIELKNRPNEYGRYYAERSDGKKFSVVDIGGLTRDMSFGWESIELDSEGELLHDTMERGVSWEVLKQILLSV